VRRPEQGVWAGLWSLPEWPDDDSLDTLAAGWPGQGEWLPPVQHALTHFDWTLHPLRWQLPARMSAAQHKAVEQALPEGRWFTLPQALAASLPAPVRKLLAGPESGAPQAAIARMRST
jgi:A/G-specific adenine glycosylase